MSPGTNEAATYGGLISVLVAQVHNDSDSMAGCIMDRKVGPLSVIPL